MVLVEEEEPCLPRDVFVQLEGVGGEVAHDTIVRVEEADVYGDHADLRADDLILRRSPGTNPPPGWRKRDRRCLACGRAARVLSCENGHQPGRVASAPAAPTHTAGLLLEAFCPGAILHQPAWRSAHH